MRIHLFGEKDKTYSGPIDQSPSYKAMTDLAKDDQVVLAKEREERAAMLLEDFGVKQDAEWETSLIYNKKGGLAPDIVNAVLILANRPELQGIVFNEFADNLELRDTVPWHHKQFWRDADDSQLNFFISSHYGPLPKQVIRDAVDKVADDRSYEAESYDTTADEVMARLGQQALIEKLKATDPRLATVFQMQQEGYDIPDIMAELNLSQRRVYDLVKMVKTIAVEVL